MILKHHPPHLCMKGGANTHLAALAISSLRDVKMAAEAWQRDGRPTVRQEHVSGHSHDEGVRHRP